MSGIRTTSDERAEPVGCPHCDGELTQVRGDRAECSNCGEITEVAVIAQDLLSSYELVWIMGRGVSHLATLGS